MTGGKGGVRKKLGLIVNPIAGMGGAVGLKGTDGAHILEKALSLGAVPRSPLRAREALAALKGVTDGVRVLTCAGEMGEQESLGAGLRAEVLPGNRPTHIGGGYQAVGPRDGGGRRHPVLFTGGDGTARDIAPSWGRGSQRWVSCRGSRSTPVFARNPTMAGELAGLFLTGERRWRSGRLWISMKRPSEKGPSGPDSSVTCWCPARGGSFRGGSRAAGRAGPLNSTG